MTNQNSLNSANHFFSILIKATLLLLAMGALTTASATGAAGLAQTTTFITSLAAWLDTTAVLVVTIALMWCGYIMIFSRGNIGQIPYIIGGGLVIGGASAIAGWILT